MVWYRWVELLEKGSEECEKKFLVDSSGSSCPTQHEATDWLTNWLTDWHLSGRIENVLHFVLGLLWDGGGKQKLQEYPAHTVVPGGGNTQIRNVCYWITKRCHRSARGRVQQWWIKPPTNERWSSQAAVVWCVKVFSGYKEWQIVLLIAYILVRCSVIHGIIIIVYIQWSWMLYPRWMCDVTQ